MTRLRDRGLDDPAAATEIARGARQAMAWRGAIAALSVVLLTVGAALAA